MNAISDLPGLAPRRAVTPAEGPTAREATDDGAAIKTVAGQRGEPADTTSSGSVDVGSATESARSPTRPRSRPRGDEVAASEQRRASTFLLPIALRSRLRAHVAASPETVPQTVLRAVESAAGRLPALLAEHRVSTGEPAAAASGLFPHVEGSGRRGAAEPTATVSIRMRAANLRVIDDLVVDTGAHSRSELLTVALAAYLGQIGSEIASR